MVKPQEISAQVFYILLSLSVTSRHGYEIMKQVEKDSNGKINLGPGTLYGAIKRLLEEKVIKESQPPSGADERRKYYSLTEKGNKILALEVDRYEQALSAVKKWNVVTSKKVVLKIA
jgi:DNA-binding PadR family transcriptional regulator